MASERKLHANQINERASTGSRNSKKHGLSLSVQADPSFLAELYDLDKAIAGANARAVLIEPACRIATAQLDLGQIRKARDFFLSEAKAILFNEDRTEGPRVKDRQIHDVIKQLTPLVTL